MVHVTREFFRAIYEADISEAQAQALLTTQLPPHSAAKNFSPGKL